MTETAFRTPAVTSRLPRVGTTIFTVMSALAQEHGADVGMSGQPLQHLVRMAVRIAAGESNQLRAAAAIGVDDLARDVMCTLDQISDQDTVADALAAVGAQVGVDHLASSMKRCPSSSV